MNVKIAILLAISAPLFTLEAVVAGIGATASRVGREEIVQAQTVPIRHSKRAVAALNPTKGNDANGVVTFEAVEGGVKIVAKIEGLTPGKHGFHIHEFGDCSAPDGASAGGHFNPTHKKHGGPDHLERHAGDLGNIVADEKGHGEYERVDSVITLSGPDTIIGRSVVIHSNADDFVTQPTGNAGGRVACGIIITR
jgi:superoxide dismutase, Cu-Zn family